MTPAQNKLFVLSLGGSLINPGEIDAKFLKDFRSLILSYTKKGFRFIIVTGGGSPTRKYQAALKAVKNTDNETLDWMGIYVTRLHAQFLKMLFKGSVHMEIVRDPNEKMNFKEPILVGGGWRPGRSTDDVSIRLAKLYGATCAINLTNIDYVYDKDPRKFKNAKKIEHISWKDFRKNIVGTKWNPGAHVPFDPVAAKSAQEAGIEVVITNGKNLKNFKNILDGKNFEGTVIRE